MKNPDQARMLAIRIHCQDFQWNSRTKLSRLTSLLDGLLTVNPCRNCPKLVVKSTTSLRSLLETYPQMDPSIKLLKSIIFNVLSFENILSTNLIMSPMSPIQVPFGSLPPAGFLTRTYSIVKFKASPMDSAISGIIPWMDSFSWIWTRGYQASNDSLIFCPPWSVKLLAYSMYLVRLQPMSMLAQIFWNNKINANCQSFLMFLLLRLAF